MKLLKVRNIALAGVVSVAGLGLIGVGAHAVFTTSTVSAQTITAGTPSVTLSGSCFPGGTCAAGTGYSVSPDGASLSFTALANQGSTFTTGDQMVTATNTGGIPLTELTFTLTAAGSPAMAGESSVCVASTGLGTNGANPFVIYNGALSGVLGTAYSQAGDTLTIAGTAYSGGPPPASGPTDNYIVNVYAGNETTACGAAWDGASTPTLNNDSEGQSIVVSTTMTYSG